MDIQGAEHRALMGMRKLLSRNPQLVLVSEYWPFALAQSGCEPAAMLELLKSLGFRPELIDERRKRVRPIEAAELLVRCTQKNKAQCNLVFRAFRQNL